MGSEGEAARAASHAADHCATLLIVKPSCDEETFAAYFHPISPGLFDDPELGPVLRRIAAEDPEILAAVADVDRSQIRDAAHQTPWERLLHGQRCWNGLARLRGEAGQPKDRAALPVLLAAYDEQKPKR